MAYHNRSEADAVVTLDCVDPDRSSGELLALRREVTGYGRTFRRMAEHYALLAGETRLKILSLLRSAGELCVCDLATVLDLTPAAVSQHLSRLRSGGLVASRRDGMTVYYRVAAEAFATPCTPPEIRARRRQG